MRAHADTEGADPLRPEPRTPLQEGQSTEDVAFLRGAQRTASRRTLAVAPKVEQQHRETRLLEVDREVDQRLLAPASLMAEDHRRGVAVALEQPTAQRHPVGRREAHRFGIEAHGGEIDLAHRDRSRSRRPVDAHRDQSHQQQQHHRWGDEQSTERCP